MKNGERAFPERRAAPREPAEPVRRTGAAAWLHHGLRAAVLLGVSIAVYLCFPGAQTSDVPVLEQGVVAREEVIAEVPFTVPKTQEELRREQEEAARGVPPVFVYRAAAGDSVVGGVRQFFGAVEQGLRTAPPGQEPLAIRAALDTARVPTTLGAIEVLADAGRRFQLQAATELAVREQFPRGVAAASPEREGFSAVQVRGLPGGERLIPADSVFTADQFYRAAQQRLRFGELPEAGVRDADEVHDLRDLGRRLVLARRHLLERRGLDALEPDGPPERAGEGTARRRYGLEAEARQRAAAEQAAAITRQGAQQADRGQNVEHDGAGQGVAQRHA
mgnify:CR=1 FL=1